MTTRISGKRLAANITTAVTVGSFAVVGIGAIAVDQATTDHSAGTSTSAVTSNDGGSVKEQAPSQRGSSSNGYSGGSSVQSGNGGTINGRSSGS